METTLGDLVAQLSVQIAHTAFLHSKPECEGIEGLWVIGLGRLPKFLFHVTLVDRLVLLELWRQPSLSSGARTLVGIAWHLAVLENAVESGPRTLGS